MQQDEVINKFADESIIWFELKDNKKFKGRCTLHSIWHDEVKTTMHCLEIYQVITHGKFASINGLIL